MPDAVNEHQPSLTEWFAAIGELEESHAFRTEDNQKAARLERLWQAIQLPYERPKRFTARQLHDRPPEVEKFLAEQGQGLCAIRLVPTEEGLPKLRKRGLPLTECYEGWFLKQDIEWDKYDAHIYAHCDQLLWSTIFVVKDTAIFGEIVAGLYSQLTQGSTLSYEKMRESFYLTGPAPAGATTDLCQKYHFYKEGDVTYQGYGSSVDQQSGQAGNIYLQGYRPPVLSFLLDRPRLTAFFNWLLAFVLPPVLLWVLVAIAGLGGQKPVKMRRSAGIRPQPAASS